MKRTVRENVNAPYSLHDRAVTGFEVSGEDVTLKTSGLTKVAAPSRQEEGYVQFYDVQWDFSFAYLLAFAGNTGTFSGEKMFLRDFIAKYPLVDFTILDETYGYNTTKFSGLLAIGQEFHECIIEIYHEGDMVFATKEE